MQACNEVIFANWVLSDVQKALMREPQSHYHLFPTFLRAFCFHALIIFIHQVYNF